MKRFLNRVWNEDAGVLTFEWILLITVLVIGIVGGLSAVRDAMITELGDVAEAMVSLDQSYTIIPPWEVNVPECSGADTFDGGSGMTYVDEGAVDNARSDRLNIQGELACPEDENP